MKLEKAKKRDKKKIKGNRMIVTGKSVYIIQNAIIKRANKIKNIDK
jgi:hypothetical protein